MAWATGWRADTGAARATDREPADAPVLAADTAVILDGKILGKPADRQDAENMLRQLSGRTHEVLTAIALRTADGVQSRISRSEVTFRRIAAAEAQAYWETGEPRDKAGAYAIQGRAAVFIADLRGSYSGVMGLPLFETAELLSRAGVAALALAAAGTMSTEILVNASSHEARAAVVENGVLQEVFLERASRRGLISNIYKGRVSRVLPGMQAAFIEIGMERTAFLHASDIFDPRHADTGIEPPRTENIRALVAEGNEILVQVVKDPLGNQGRPPDHLHHAALPLPGVHAERAMASGSRRGSRTRASASGCAAAVQAGIDARGERGIHRAHGRGGCVAGGLAGRHGVFAQAVGVRAPEGTAHPARQSGARRFAAAFAHPARFAAAGCRQGV